jgi:hypothetical protein
MAPKTFSTLEKTILKAKGMTDADITRLQKVGVRSRGDFATVGDAKTLTEIAGLKVPVARAVMAWATGSTAPATGAPSVVVESADVVYCIHCQKRQPKDYKVGDLCPACGKQAEPVLSCYWCGQSGPGKFCRACAAEFVPTGELELALLLKRDGVAKDEIAVKLRGMSAKDKETLWGRVRSKR